MPSADALGAPGSASPCRLKCLCACAAGGASDGICFQKALWGAVDRDKVVAPLITKSDQQFERNDLEFVFGTDQLALEDLLDLFHKVSCVRAIQAAGVWSDGCFCTYYVNTFTIRDLLVATREYLEACQPSRNCPVLLAAPRDAE